MEHPFKFGDKVMFVNGEHKGKWGVVAQLLPRSTFEEKNALFGFVIVLRTSEQSPRSSMECVHGQNHELEKLPDNFFV